MAEAQPFAYSTLSAREIRVLVPDASDADSGLSWSLVTANVDDPNLRFTALSYAWATQSYPERFPISCNGRQLLVHYNLYTALPFLARRSKAETSVAVPYWVDAICINQTDEGEKISQISLMNTIYRQADKVLIWLGLALKPEQQDLIPRAIELLPLLNKEQARCRQSPAQHNFEVARELSHLGRDGWEAILHLMRNSYFRRVWMVQEVALAKEIMFLCGDHQISLQLMEKAVVDSSNIRNWVIYDLTNGGRMRVQAQSHDDSIIFSIRHIVQADSGDYNAEGNAHQTIRIVNLMDNQTCFAAQDRVLGILGMVGEEFGDAGKDLHTYTSIPDLYTRFSTLLFETSGPAVTKLHWWYYMSMAFNLTRIDGLPSWVPDLHNNDAQSKRQPFESMLSARVYSNPPWQASSKPAIASKGRAPDEILLRGKILDEIILVHPEVPHFPDDSEPGYGDETTWLRILIHLVRWEAQLAETVLDKASRTNTAAPANNAVPIRVSEDTYWRTLLLNMSRDITSGTPFSHDTYLRFRQAGTDLLRTQHLEDSLSYAAANTTPTQALTPFRDPAHPVCSFVTYLAFTRDHCLFNTLRGSFGVSVTGIRAGDLVVLLSGAAVLYVLRRVGEKYVFVGDAFVQGFMYGEGESDVEGVQGWEGDFVIV